MANTMYNVAKLEMETGGFSWGDGLWYAVLTNSSYVPNFVTDASKSVWAADIIGTATAMTGNSTASSPILVSNSVTFTGISSSLTVAAVIVYHDTGSVSFPAFYFNVGTGLPLTTTGANVTVDWNGTSPSGNVMTL